MKDQEDEIPSLPRSGVGMYTRLPLLAHIPHTPNTTAVCIPTEDRGNEGCGVVWGT